MQRNHQTHRVCSYFTNRRGNDISQPVRIYFIQPQGTQRAVDRRYLLFLNRHNQCLNQGFLQGIKEEFKK